MKNRQAIYYATGVAGLNYITSQDDQGNRLLLCSMHDDSLALKLKESLLKDKKTTVHWCEFFSIKKGYLADILEKSQCDGYSMVLADGRTKDEIMVGQQ